MINKNKILPQMFDVRPVDNTGEVDYVRIRTIKKVVLLRSSPSKKKVEIERVLRRRSDFPSSQINMGFPKKTHETKSPVEIQFRAKTIQFNRFAFKKEQEIPHLLKSDYVPNAKKISFSDVVSGGDLPQRNVVFSKTKQSLENVLEKQKRPIKFNSDLIRKEKRKVLSPNSSKDKEFEEKFSNFFKSETPGFERKRKAVSESDFQGEFSSQKKKSGPNKKQSGRAIKQEISFENSHIKPKKKGFLGILSLNYSKNAAAKSFARPISQFVLLVLGSAVLFGGALFFSLAFQVKEDVEVRGRQVLSHIAKAQEGLKGQDFASAGANLEDARKELEATKDNLNSLGGDALDIFHNLPFLSKISSGKNVIEAANELIGAAQELSLIAGLFSEAENPLGGTESSKSITEIFLEAQTGVERAKKSLDKANEHMAKVRVEDLPSEHQNKLALIKESLPIIVSLVERFDQNSQVFLELLGNNGPRKYLFLFQNNQEMRATGGFIGSYGLLSISNGEIKNLLIDGIFNPDGQLKSNVVPPKPIQKISVGWSTHDANWFPNFPTSAEKIAWFYEKTGGPTVDGVITLTPTVLQKMLKITGPINMEEYGVVIDAENFVAKTQYEVEVNYDKELNQPKKFIADLAPKILDKLFSQKDPIQIARVASVLDEALREKHILLYYFDQEVQEIISKQGWSGEILDTEKDFLMVVNSNINGFKTDGIIEEKIEHKAQVQADGSVIDTVKITRKHNGGDSQYEWWNKVNANYMRVYVPKGSKLISAKGHTREVIEPPVDYEKLRFEVHSDVLEQERSIKIDEQTGTSIYEEEDKTVFANWVYVSPKETSVVEYSYLLPFEIDLNKNSERADTYALLAQKQAGSLGSEFVSLVETASNLSPIWAYPENTDLSVEGEIRTQSKLTRDIFIGVVFQDTEKRSNFQP